MVSLCGSQDLRTEHRRGSSSDSSSGDEVLVIKETRVPVHQSLIDLPRKILRSSNKSRLIDEEEEEKDEERNYY